MVRGAVGEPGELYIFEEIPIPANVRHVSFLNLDSCDVCLRTLAAGDRVGIEVNADTGDIELTCTHCLDGRALSAVD